MATKQDYAIIVRDAAAPWSVAGVAANDRIENPTEGDIALARQTGFGMLVEKPGSRKTEPPSPQATGKSDHGGAESKDEKE